MKQKRKEFDVFGIILGIVIGCILGFFLGGRISRENNRNVLGPHDDDKKFVYLLQLERFSNYADAKDAADLISNKDLAIAVCKEDIGGVNYYFLYGYISINKKDVEQKKDKYQDLGFDLEVKEKYLTALLDKVSNNTVVYDFYNEAINLLYDSVSGKKINVSDEFLLSPQNLQIASWFSYLKSLDNGKTKTEVCLYIYSDILEALK